MDINNIIKEHIDTEKQKEYLVLAYGYLCRASRKGKYNVDVINDFANDLDKFIFE